MPHRSREAFAVQVAHKQRRSPSQAEVSLWRALRNRGLGVKFRRQVPIGPYVVDFVCLELRLIVETDGPIHAAAEQQARDAKRDAYLKAEGFRMLRLPDDLVRGSTELAVQRIRQALTVA
jgi:very-short-patch-repair endonuclease